MRSHPADDVRDFFAWSDWLDWTVLRPLSHIAPNWETQWDHGEKRYKQEPFSFAEEAVTLVAGLVMATGGPVTVRVVNVLSAPILVPAELLATIRKW